MIAYGLAPLFTIGCVAVFLALWVRRFQRQHRERLGLVADSAAENERIFREKKKVWDESQKTIQSLHTARVEDLLSMLRVESAELSAGVGVVTGSEFGAAKIIEIERSGG
jgi:hypothetical protein